MKILKVDTWALSLNRLSLHVLRDKCTLFSSIPASVMALTSTGTVLMNTWVSCKLYKINLKLLINLDRRTSKNQLHRNISLLKASDIYTVGVLCFVNNFRAARCPETFCNYYKVRQTERELLNKDSLGVPWARTDMGVSSCNIKRARL